MLFGFVFTWRDTPARPALRWRALRAVASAEKALGEIRLSSDDTEKFKKTYRDLPAVALSRPQQMSGSNGSAAAIVTQPNPQENADVKEVLLKAQELLAKANGGTCSNSCNCAIA